MWRCRRRPSSGCSWTRSGGWYHRRTPQGHGRTPLTSANASPMPAPWPAHPRMWVTGHGGETRHPHHGADIRGTGPDVRARHFVWIMGADSFAGLHHWNEWREIPATLPLAVFDRPGWSLKALGSPAARLLQRYRLDVADAPCWRPRGHLPGCFSTCRLRYESSTAIRVTADLDPSRLHPHVSGPG